MFLDEIIQELGRGNRLEFREFGVFEIKEHLIAIGLGLLPAYWQVWRQPNDAQGAQTVSARRALTWLLAVFVWWGFIVGHVLNNIRGLLP